MQIEIRVLDTEQAITALEEKAAKIGVFVRDAMPEVTGNLLAYTKDEGMMRAGLHQRSGNLKASGFTEQIETSGEVEGFVGFGRTVPYARALNYGGSWTIPEVDGKLMVFQRSFGGLGAEVPWAGVGGGPIFTMRHREFSIQMPEYNYLESSAEAQTPVIIERFRQAAEEACA